jgi:predicted PurR-regulated permease PerM
LSVILGLKQNFEQKMYIRQSPFYTRLAYTLISIVIIIYGLYILKDLLIPLIFSGLLAILLTPGVQFLERWRFPRSLAITVTIIVAVSILGLFFYIIYIQIVNLEEILPQLQAKIEEWTREIQTLIRKNFHISKTKQAAEGQKYLTEFLKNNGSIFTDTLSTTTNFLGNLALIPLYVFLLLLYRDFIKVFFYKLFKSVSHHRIDIVLHNVKDVVVNYVVGLIMVIGVIGTLNTLGLWILGIDHAIFFGFFAAVLVLIPYIGIAIGSLLPIMMALITKDSYWHAVGVAAIFGTVQFLEGNFITPYIVGSKVSINSMAAIISLILFGNLWGVSGLVLALPLTAIIKVIFDSYEPTKPYGFLIGDADHVDVVERKQKK